MSTKTEQMVRNLCTAARLAEGALFSPGKWTATVGSRTAPVTAEVVDNDRLEVHFEFVAPEDGSTVSIFLDGALMHVAVAEIVAGRQVCVSWSFGFSLAGVS